MNEKIGNLQENQKEGPVMEEVEKLKFKLKRLKD